MKIKLSNFLKLRKINHPYMIGDLVSHQADNCPFEVVGIRKNGVELLGDWSGGTYNVKQASWVHPDEIKFWKKEKEEIKTCKTCYGDGWVYQTKGGQHGLIKDCLNCNGKGII